MKTTGDVFLYTASGHGSWEATLVNLFSPGNTVLVVETGYFSEGWTEMADRYGLKTRVIAADWRRGVAYADITAALKDDPAIAGVMCVHNETATGLALDLPAVRAAIDEAGSPALLLVDTISSLGSLPFDFDGWRIDAAVGGSQKGLMLPHRVQLHRGQRQGHGGACPRQAAAVLFRLDEYAEAQVPQLRRHHSRGYVLRADGIRAADRTGGVGRAHPSHHRLAEATRRAVRVWAANDGPQLFCLDPARFSDSVTALWFPEGHDANATRKTAFDRFNVSTGGAWASWISGCCASAIWAI